jgi:hypothetical protein
MQFSSSAVKWTVNALYLGENLMTHHTQEATLMYRSSADNILLNPNEPLSSSISDEENEDAVEAYGSEKDDAPRSRSIASAEPPVISTSG